MKLISAEEEQNSEAEGELGIFQPKGSTTKKMNKQYSLWCAAIPPSREMQLKETSLCESLKKSGITGVKPSF